ncbi:MAG: hypothetical protein ABI644_09805 [Arenimonas sp.]
MLELIRKSSLSNDFIAKEHGVTVAELDRATWSQNATVEIQGKTYNFKKSGVLHSVYTLLDGRLEVTQVEQPSAWQSKLVFRLDGKEYALDTKNWFSSALNVEQDGNLIGDIHSAGMLSSTIVVDLPDLIPLHVRVFVGWIALLRIEETAVVIGAAT